MSTSCRHKAPSVSLAVAEVVSLERVEETFDKGMARRPTFRRMRNPRRLTLLVLIVTITSGCAARSRSHDRLLTLEQLDISLKGSCPPPDPPGTPAPCGQLGTFDRLFIDSYQAAQDYTRQHHGPVVIVSGSSLVLVLEGVDPVPVRVIPDIYHALKAVAHFPFAIYLTVNGEVGRDLSIGTRATLETFLVREAAARSELARFTLSTGQISRQHRILDRSNAFIRQALKTGIVLREDLNAFAHAVGPLLLENTRDAGCAQILSTHRQMKTWRAAHPSVDWPSLVVVNRSAHQARYRNAATQYFAWLIGGSAASWNYPGESLRVVYAEDIFSRPGANPSGTDLAMQVFSTITLDAAASRAFFGDEWRLSEDVLSDGAAVCVSRLPSEERWAR